MPPAEITASGSGELLAFAVADGVTTVATTRGVLALRGSDTIAQWLPESQLVGASFGRDAIAVTTGASVTILETGLEERVRIVATEPCGHIALVDGSALFCAEASDAERRFYAYDLASGAEITWSGPFIEASGPLANVPARRLIVGVDPASVTWSPVSAFEVTGGFVRYVATSDIDIEESTSSVMAFAGADADVLVTHRGWLLELAGCESLRPECLTTLGRLERIAAHRDGYVAMTRALDGNIVGLAQLPRASSLGPVCTPDAPCVVEHVVVAEDRVLRETHWAEPLERPVGLRVDPTSAVVYVGWSHDCSRSGCERWSIGVAMPGSAP